MCGRYVLVTLVDVQSLLPDVRFDLVPTQPRYNIAPTQGVAAVTNKPKPFLDLLHWGLIPSWAKDTKIGNKMINARAETLAVKPAFRNALERKRCLIFADGFYEWRQGPSGAKQPVYIRMRDHHTFAFAGIWADWSDATGSEIESCTIITTTPNALLKTMHDRMPVILPREGWHDWLDPQPREPKEMASWLRPYPADQMEMYDVSRQVNNARTEGAALIEPAVTTSTAAVLRSNRPRSQRHAGPEEPGLFG
jgi:putative SOS response-associated peptidase YedK